MLFRSPPTFLLGLIMAGLLFLPGSAFAAKGTIAEQYDVKLVARPDGSLMVTETIVLRFEGGPFTYVYREIPTDFTDGLAAFTGSMDGVPFPAGKETGQLEISGKDPVRLTWHFSPVSDTTRTFILNYRVLGVTQVDEEFDLLRWNAVPFEHDYPILASTVQLTYPRRARIAGNPEAATENARVTASGSSLLFEAQDLKEDQGLQISVRFARNSLISDLPAWQRHRVETSQAIYRVLPWALATFALLLLAGIGALYLAWEHKAGIDRGEEPSPAMQAPTAPQPQPAAGTHLTSPPGDLAPAIAGALIASGVQPGWPQALAALLDLARQGIVRIQEYGEKGWFRQRDFTIQLISHPAELKPHEHGLLDMLFETAKGTRPVMKVSEIGSAVSAHFDRFSKPLKEELRHGGLLSPPRQAVKNRMSLIGILLLIGGLVIFIVSLITGKVSIDAENWSLMTAAAVALSVGAGSMLIGLAVILVTSFYSPLTGRGLQEAANWRAYSEYLREVTREREPVTTSRLFESALPYAASFGLGEAWSKFFQKQGESSLPAWFQALSTSGDAGMAAFVAMIAVSSTAGSGGAGGGSAGGAGAAGGGSSGAG